ncbi:uncharacterized transporter slc-17.3-like, partial [Cimex lectularius]|uniref:Uncharacterized protein n=1 Tax=Cimex lectularius TaxID=79782 RepID=A0A8I6SBG5_CIMLE
MVGFSEHHWFGSRHVVIILLTLSQSLNVNYMYVTSQLYERTYGHSHGASDIFHMLNDIPKEHIKYYRFVSEGLTTVLGVISAILTLKISNKYFLFLSNALNAVISFALPFLLTVAESYAFGITMIVFSLARSIHWCTTLCLIGKWIPTHEICRSLAIIFSFGCVFGGTLFMIAELIRNETNYPNSFYFLGTVTTLWLILWFLFGAGSPNDCAFTTEGEKRYIYKSLEFVRPKNSKTPIPWKDIIKCRSLYTTSVAITSFFQSFYNLGFSEFHWESIFSIILSQSREQ